MVAVAASIQSISPVEGSPPADPSEARIMHGMLTFKTSVERRTSKSSSIKPSLCAAHPTRMGSETVTICNATNEKFM